MKYLLAHAASMGLSVHATHLEEGTLGLYSHAERRIYFDIRLTPNERRSVIAHEIGHAHYGHVTNGALQERQADIYAARLLISPHAYAALERVNSDQHLIAEELGVTLDLIYTFEAHCLQRLRGVTYARPRMGAGQWAYREQAV